MATRASRAARTAVTASGRSRYAFAAAGYSRPRYVPQTGHTRCDSFGEWQVEQAVVFAASTPCWARRRSRRDFDVFFLGTAIGAAAYRTVRAGRRRPTCTCRPAYCSRRSASQRGSAGASCSCGPSLRFAPHCGHRPRQSSRQSTFGRHRQHGGVAAPSGRRRGRRPRGTRRSCRPRRRAPGGCPGTPRRRSRASTSASSRQRWHGPRSVTSKRRWKSSPERSRVMRSSAGSSSATGRRSVSWPTVNGSTADARSRSGAPRRPRAAACGGRT